MLWLVLSPRRHMAIHAGSLEGDPLLILRGEGLGILRKEYAVLEGAGQGLGRLSRNAFSLSGSLWRFEDPSGGVIAGAKGAPRILSLALRLGPMLLIPFVWLWAPVPPLVLSTIRKTIVWVLSPALLFQVFYGSMLYTRYRLLDAGGREAGRLDPILSWSKRGYRMEMEGGFLESGPALALGTVLSLELSGLG